MKSAKLLQLVWIALTVANCAFAQTWTQTSAPSNDWNSVACSADGTKIAALASDGIYFSTNSGATWTLSGAPMSSVALSADGNKWAAVNNGFDVYTSTNWGTTWATNNMASKLIHYDFGITLIASSADGSKLMTGPEVSISSDSGMTWTATGLTVHPSGSVASSADGTKLFAATASGVGFGVYLSTNSGAYWFSNSAPVFFIESIASSADGNKLALITGSGIFISTNMGTIWTETTNLPAAIFLRIASSADGSKLIASDNETLYVSVDSGATWTTNNPDGANTEKTVTLSVDGNKFIAAVNGGGIWISQTTPTPQLNLAASSSNLALSWTIPSTNFVLQQSADLVSWSNVTDPPVFNFATLQNQVAVTPTNAAAFYRLSTP